MGRTSLLSDQGCSTVERCHSFTLFREPIARLVSAYFYCRGFGHGDQLCASDQLNAREATIEQFADHWGNYLFRQLLLLGEEVENIHALIQSATFAEPFWYKQKRHLAGYDTFEHGHHSLDVLIDGLPRLFSMIG